MGAGERDRRRAHYGQRWAFSLSNAGAFTTEFRTDMADLGDIDWPAVDSSDYRDRGVRERKQAEFLVEHGLPWSLVRRIGVRSQRIATKVHEILASAEHRPQVVIKPEWYY